MWQTVRELAVPFLWGGVLALFLNLPLTRLERRLGGVLLQKPRLRRGLALGLLLAALAAGIGLGLWLLVPQLAAAAMQLTEWLPRLWDRATDWLGGIVSADTAHHTGMMRSLQGLQAAGSSALDTALRTGIGALVDAAAGMGDLLLAVVLAVYLLADKEGHARHAQMVLRAAVGPRRTAQLAAFFARAQQVFARFVAGQCIEAMILAGLFVLVLFVFGFPNVLPVAAVIGVTALVPVFGTFVGGAAGVLLVLPAGIERAGWFLVLFLLVQQLENNLIYPHVVGSRIGLPPLWVLTAVLVGGGLFGVAGLVLGIPAVSVAYHLGRDWVYERLAAQQQEERE